MPGRSGLGSLVLTALNEPGDEPAIDLRHEFLIREDAELRAES